MQAYAVVIPAFNAARTVAETLASVLAQTVPPAEVVVVDDGSTDDTVAVAAAVSPQVRVLRQANAGPGAATTLGVRQTATPIVAMLDADDLWLPHKMALQLQHLTDDPRVAAVGCAMRQFRHGVPDDGQGEIRQGLMRSGLVVRRSVFDAVGDIIDPPGKRGDMIDWVGRLREGGHRLDVLPEVLALRRILPGSLSYGRSAELNRDYLKVAHLAMLRRRAKQSDEPGGHSP